MLIRVVKKREVTKTKMLQPSNGHPPLPYVTLLGESLVTRVDGFFSMQSSNEQRLNEMIRLTEMGRALLDKEIFR